MKTIKTVTQDEFNTAFMAAKENKATDEQMQMIYHWALSNYWRYNRHDLEDSTIIMECDCGNGKCCQGNNENQ